MADPPSARVANRLWQLRVIALAAAVAGAASVTICGHLFKLPRASIAGLDFVVIGAGVFIAMRAETAVTAEDVQLSDAELIKRFKTIALKRFLLTMPIFGTFFVVGQALGNTYFHLTLMETFVLGVLPSIVVVNLIQNFLPISAGTDAETRRANLLIAEQVRRALAKNYLMFVFTPLIGISILIPDMIRATHDLPIHLRAISDSAFFALIALMFFTSPWILRQPTGVAELQEDESLGRFRLIACRNAFLVLAIGIVAAADLGRHVRIAMLLMPAVLNLSLGVAFATVALLERNAGALANAETSATSELEDEARTT